MMAQSRAESTWDIYNYRKYINQFPPNTIKAIRQYERIKKKICRQKMSISTKFVWNMICKHFGDTFFKGARSHFFCTQMVSSIPIKYE